MTTTIEVHQDKQKIYDILFDEQMECFAEHFQTLGFQNRKFCIVTDSNIEPHHAENVRTFFEPLTEYVCVFTMPAGENHKTVETVCALYQFLIEHHFDRHDCLAAFGGGVVGDLTGFAAATYLRGIDFIQIPTSLLAMVDSSVGGKTGVDFDAYKNMVGAFKMPKAVYINTAFLETLPEIQYFNGMAEVIKYGAILDLSFYEFLLTHMAEILAHDPEIVKQMVIRCCKLKCRVVEEDPLEHGLRAILNFGHTVGHAIEKQKEFQLLHGQCVALGMVCAAYLSWKRGMIEQEEYLELRDVLVAFRLPITVDGISKEEILTLMKSDKKMDANTLKFILLRAIGDAYVDQTVTDEEILEAIEVVLYQEGEIDKEMGESAKA